MLNPNTLYTILFYSHAHDASYLRFKILPIRVSISRVSVCAKQMLAKRIMVCQL